MRKVSFVISILAVFAVTIFFAGDLFSNNVEDPIEEVKERNWYLKVSKKPSKFIRIQSRRFKERKTHDYYRCNKCGTYNRIPKGHGKILITCPKCSNQFERR